MLKKLFISDFMSIRKKVLPLMLFAAITAIITTVCFRINTILTAKMQVAFALNTINVFLGIFSALGIMAVAILICMMIYYAFMRYYKNFFTDEGYLTFTLPAKNSTLLLAKFWSILLWETISFVYLLVLFFIIITFGPVESGIANFTELKEFFAFIGDAFKTLGGFMTAFETILLIAVALVSNCFLIFYCVSVSSTKVKKHKMLVGIGVYYLAMTVVSLVSSLVISPLFTMIMTGITSVDSIVNGVTSMIHVSLWSYIILLGAVGAISALLNYKLLKNSLDLS